MAKEQVLLDVHAIRSLLDDIAAVPPEIPTCAETFRVLDEYVDRLAAGEPVESLMPAVKYHLDMCPACGEQFELLRDIIIEEFHEK